MQKREKSMAIRLYLGSRKQLSLLTLSVYSVNLWLERIGGPTTKFFAEIEESERLVVQRAHREMQKTEKSMAIRLYLGSRKQLSLLLLSVYSVTMWLERIGGLTVMRVAAGCTASCSSGQRGRGTRPAPTVPLDITQSTIRPANARQAASRLIVPFYGAVHQSGIEAGDMFLPGLADIAILGVDVNLGTGRKKRSQGDNRRD
jgi:hypothetical protein